MKWYRGAKSEAQPRIVGYCRECGAELYNCTDWEKPRWYDEDNWGDPNCDHELEDAIDRLVNYKW